QARLEYIGMLAMPNSTNCQIKCIMTYLTSDHNIAVLTQLCLAQKPYDNTWTISCPDKCANLPGEKFTCGRTIPQGRYQPCDTASCPDSYNPKPPANKCYGHLCRTLIHEALHCCGFPTDKGDLVKRAAIC